MAGITAGMIGRGGRSRVDVCVVVVAGIDTLISWTGTLDIRGLGCHFAGLNIHVWIEFILEIGPVRS